jgi:hypothetical protein
VIVIGIMVTVLPEHWWTCGTRTSVSRHCTTHARHRISRWYAPGSCSVSCYPCCLMMVVVMSILTEPPLLPLSNYTPHTLSPPLPPSTLSLSSLHLSTPLHLYTSTPTPTSTPTSTPHCNRLIYDGATGAGAATAWCQPEYKSPRRPHRPALRGGIQHQAHHGRAARARGRCVFLSCT